MKSLTMVGLVLSAALTYAATALASESADTVAVPEVPYSYKMNLDVAKVISLETPHTDNCEIVQSKMTYLDNNDTLRIITYRKHSDACAVGS